jgi:gliding motility-associated-like protein
MPPDTLVCAKLKIEQETKRRPRRNDFMRGVLFGTNLDLICLEKKLKKLITIILNIVEDAALYIPNTFSPDGNAFNNVFKVAGRNIDLNQFELTIYNRWGEIIFISQDPNIGWDGAIANKGLAPIGTYTYQVVYRFVNASESETLTGHLNLIR